MKIGLVVPGGVDRSGERRVVPVLLWKIERLARAHELHVFALRQEPRPGRWELRGAHIHNVGARPRRLRALASVVREHLRGRFDVLHGIWTLPHGVIAGVAGRMLGVPVVVEAVGGEVVSMPEIDFGGARTARSRFQLDLAFRMADRILTPTRFMQALIRERGQECTVVPEGVALDRWPPATPRPRDPASPARLLFVGSLNRVKDPETLLRAVAEVLRRGRSVELDVVGEDLRDGVPARLAEELGLSRSVRFHGFLTHRELRPLYDEAHVLVVSSRHEGGPVVALEAAVAGLAVVGTAVGHLADLAPDGARVAPPGDPDALADVVEAVVVDDELRLSLARNAQARALAWDADRTATALTEVYAGLVAGTRNGGPARIPDEIEVNT